jgi:NAD+ synthase
MTNKLNISIAQINFTVGDLDGNQKKILAAHKKASAEKSDLIIFSELAITGYPPEDLVLRPDFRDKAIEIVRELAPHTSNGTAILVGGIWHENYKFYNSAFLLEEGQIQHITCKYDLPNYSVFDEKRVFSQAPLPEPLLFRDVQLGVMICEDMWNKKIATHLKEQGAEILIAINASPFDNDKQRKRLEAAKRNANETSLPLIYVNQVGGQDELVFDGGSFILNKKGQLFDASPFWKESITTITWIQSDNGAWTCDKEPQKEFSINNLENIYAALKTGLYDYISKNKFPGVVIGMSGGIDSAITAAIAVDALGKDRVRLVMMPSKYTSEESINDADECAKLLGVQLETISIEQPMESFTETLRESFKGCKSDLTEENLQSRIRGNILMALSNKFGHMVLTTGNKSEVSVGYATLYGDMCGGYNILKDVYKTEVFKLAKWINKQKYVIPENIISKAPTAELRPNQKDEDSLPPYDILDDILHRLIEMRHSSEQIIQHGHVPEVVHKVAKLVKLSEYKRRQSAPGVKITSLAFGRDRRYPVTNGFEF